MNYLKKKLKAHKKAVEDDEDYGDYIPVAPPHPDDLLKNQQNLASPFAINNDLYIKNPEADQQQQQQQQSTSQDNEQSTKPQPKFIRKPKEENEQWQYFAQLSARVQETVSKTEKELEKIKATTKVEEFEKAVEKEYYFAEELENFDREFEEKFSSLETAKKVSKSNQIKSPSVALNLNEKLKTSPSNPQNLNSNLSTPTSIKSFKTTLTPSASSTVITKKNVVASTTSNWVGFNRDSVEILDDDDDEELLRQQEEERKEKERKEEEERKRKEEEIKQKLLDDFGFIESASSQDLKNIPESTSLDKIIDYENDYLDDPFNTEFAEKKYESTKDLTSKIEKLEKELSSTHLNQILNNKPTTLDLSGDPSLNKQIDRTTSSQNIKDYNNKIASSKYSSVPCTPGDKIEPDEIDILATLETGRLSRYNSKESLALAEQQLSRTNSVQSIHSILSNQSRRSSTNPFDIDTEAAINQPEESEDVPNVIAALTEDFYKTIGNLDKEEEEEKESEITLEEKNSNKKVDSIEQQQTEQSLKDKSTELVDEKSKQNNKDSCSIEKEAAAAAEEEEEVEQINQESDNDLANVDDELNQEVIIKSDYIIEEADEENSYKLSEESVSEEIIQQASSEKEGDKSEDLIESMEKERIEFDKEDTVENLNENLDEINVLSQLQFDELGNIKCEFDDKDIEEVQNFIKEQIPFDPFETIVEDEPTNSNSNRQSVSSPPITDLSLNKQNSLDKDSAFKDVPSDDLINNKSEPSETNNLIKSDLSESNSLNKNDLNNNSKQFNQSSDKEVPSSSETNNLPIDSEQLKVYFDPFQTVHNDITPTSEVLFTVGKNISDSDSNNQNHNLDLQSTNYSDLPPPPTDLEIEEQENQASFISNNINNNKQLEMSDNETGEGGDVNLDDLPPPPPELTVEDDSTELQKTTDEQPQQQQPPQTIQNDEQFVQEENSVVKNNDDEPKDENVESKVSDQPDKNETVHEEPIKIDSSINLDIKAEAAITSDELAELVVDPFDTSVYNYDTLKSFIPVASKDQVQQFNEKFNKKEETTDDSTYLDAFKSPLPQRKRLANKNEGFDTFDPFQTTRPPKNTPLMKRKQIKIKKAKSTSDTDEEEEEDSSDLTSSSDDEREKLRFVIRARMKEDIENQENMVVPLIPPPPMTPTKSPKHQLRGVYNKPLLQVGRNRAKLREEYKRIHKKSLEEEKEEEVDKEFYANLRKKYEEEHPEAAEEPPLFEEDTTELENYENPYENLEWNFYCRYPIKKKITGNRFWKLVTVKFLPAINTVQLYAYVPKSSKPPPAPEDCAEPPVEADTTGEPLQELLLQGSYNVSDIASQQYDDFGKILTIKLQYKFYREKAAADTGKKIAHNMKIFQGKIANFTKKFNDVVNVNVNNIVDLTNKDNILVAMAMLQHTPQITELFKFGCHNYEHLKQFKAAIEETLFKMPVARDRALTYKAEEMQIQMQDEYYCELNTAGIIQYHKARVRLFLLSFLNGMPVVEIGINDRTREGKEVVGRNDIMPIETEEWIRVENVEFHSCVDKSAFQADDKMVKLIPPDACTIEVMRFRVRPSRNRELPLLVNARMLINPRKVELRIEAMAAGASTKRRDAENVIPCEDIVIKVKIPQPWWYFFRVEKHTRFGSVKSASRRPGKIKGIERILGATTNIPLESSTLLEASAGQAKYEHAFQSLVWRIPRLPKEGQGAYREQICTMKLPLTPDFDKIPEHLDDDVLVEYRMPATTISHAVVRSISISQSDSDTPPEKYASYVSKIDYKLKMSIEHESDINPYLAVTQSAIKKPVQETPIEEKDSDDDIDYDDEDEIDEEE